jgi:transaldolase / glucose-6-phosphate isomerase
MTTTTTLPNASAVRGGNPLRGLLAHGQSPWLDFIRRNILLNGDLKKMIADDGLRGMTSNPAIFEKAITGSDDYNDLLNAPEAKKLNAKGLYEQIAIRDVQTSADIFRSVYDETKGRDGFVSLEVSPTLANDTQGTLEEARRLWKAVNRPNLMVKVPATREGIPAIRQLLEEGININITLLFAQSAYEQVAEAYISALEARAAKGQEVSKIASVASFFVSRIDTLIDGQIDAKLKTETDGKKKELLTSVQGKVAIANARRTYAKYQELVGGARWKALESKGAHTQRLLWASTSTKNKNYRDVLYVEELIGADTVDTIPPATFDAFRDHGKLRNSLTENVAGANKTMADLEAAGISMKEVTDKLIADGVKLFADAFTTLLAAVEKHAGVRA